MIWGQPKKKPWEFVSKRIKNDQRCAPSGKMQVQNCVYKNRAMKHVENVLRRGERGWGRMVKGNESG
jgi:hypothetical protein